MAELLQTGSYRFLESAKEELGEERTEQSMRQLRTVLDYFPELHKHVLTIALTHPDVSYHAEPYAMVDTVNKIVYLNSDSATEYMTLFHELEHIVIREEHEQGKDVPITSEEYCSIRSVARMPVDLIYRKDVPYLGEPDAPQDDWPKICQRALAYREKHRNYIQKCKEWLRV